MGNLVVTIGIGDQQGKQFEDLEVTVDTGSTFTTVPRLKVAVDLLTLGAESRLLVQQALLVQAASSNNPDTLSQDGELPFGQPGRRSDDTPEGSDPSPLVDQGSVGSSASPSWKE